MVAGRYMQPAQKEESHIGDGCYVLHVHRDLVMIQRTLSTTIIFWLTRNACQKREIRNCHTYTLPCGTNHG